MLLSVLNGVLALLLSGAALTPQQLLGSASPDHSNGTQIWRDSFLRNHYIEVKKCGLCDGADLWSGYYHSVPENISIFFVYARASEAPETSPLALWTNGGPGTSGLGVAFSSATGCTLQDDARGMKLVYNPKVKRWNEKVNVIFLDQPIGTGFSRGTGRGEQDTRVGAEYIYNFIQVVLSRHPTIPEVSLHSLSYGGHFVSEWAHKIVSENSRAQEGITNNHIIPLKSVSMGNAWFGADEQYLERFDSLCELHPYLAGSTAPILSSSECQRAATHRATCADLLTECRNHSAKTCAGAHLWCLTATGYYIGQTGRSMYDLSSFSDNPDAYDTYPVLNRYLNQRAVQVALGVIGPDDKHPVEWLFYNTRVSALHTLAGDHVRRTDTLLPAIVAAGVNILIYQGTTDYIVGYQGVRGMLESLNMVQGQVANELKVWENGAGRYLCSTNPKIPAAGRFCYLEIDGVGHGVAYDYEGWPLILEKWLLQGSV
jgi:carboxypeptidase C (cathepsin A)